MPALDKEVDLARRLARDAGLAALRRRGTGIGFESKSDDSPVTDADRESERIIARGIEEAFPEDGQLGEEGTSKESRSGRRWIIDPIDGTRDFVRNNLTWAVLIAVEEGGHVVAGVAHFPALERTYFALRGGGAFLNDGPIRISAVNSIGQAVVGIDGFHNAGAHPFAGRIAAWLASCWAFRSMGGCLDAVLVAAGQADVWIELSAKPWDFAPLKVIAEEAGARFLNFDGGSSIYRGSAIICVPALAEEVLRFVRGPSQ